MKNPALHPLPSEERRKKSSLHMIPANRRSSFFVCPFQKIAATFPLGGHKIRFFLVRYNVRYAQWVREEWLLFSDLQSISFFVLFLFLFLLFFSLDYFIFTVEVLRLCWAPRHGDGVGRRWM
jgi:hypothetical protein